MVSLIGDWLSYIAVAVISVQKETAPLRSVWCSSYTRCRRR